MTDWSPTAQHLVELRGVVKSYDTPAGPFLALRGVDLDIDRGEFVAVIGKSGSGKSTLINAIAGIDRPTAGSVTVAGAPVHSLGEDDVAKWRGSNLGVIFQFFQLLPTLTLLENVVLPMEFARRGSAGERREQAMALLERVEMADHAHKLPSGVSGGQQQRVAIARALANDPALIVADEPTGSLDSRTADKIFQLFEELVDHGKTVLMVTHDSELASRAARVVLIVDGQVVESHVRSALGGVTEDDLVEISARLEPHLLEPGAVVFAEGDVADRFYIVVRGSVEVVRSGPAGVQEFVAMLGPGQYFGETGLITGNPRNATIRVPAHSDASLVSLDADMFRRLVGENALANDAVAKVMRDRLTAATVRAAVPLTAEATRTIAQNFERRDFGAGELILGPGEPADRFCVVADGVVEVLGADGAVAFRYRRGRHFGAAGLSHNGLSISTLRAAGDETDGTTIVSIPADVHQQIVTTTGLTNHHVSLLLAEAGAQ